MLGSSMGMGMVPELHPDVWGVWKKFQMTNLSMPINFSFMKYAEKSVPGLADVGVLHGDGDGPRAPPRCPKGVWKFFQMTNLTMPNNFYYMKYALESVPGLADVGVLHGDGVGPQNSTKMSGGSRKGQKKFQMTTLTMLIY